MEIIITKQDVRVLDNHGEILASCETQSFFQLLNSATRGGTSPSSGILPPRVIWFTPEMNGVIFERPPFSTASRWQPGTMNQHGETSDIDLPIPWQVYGIVFDPAGQVVAMKIFARNYPVMTATDTLGVLPIPNMDHTSSACLGPAFHKYYRHAITPKDPASEDFGARIATAVNTFWSGTFNNDFPNWADAWRLPPQVPANIRDVNLAGHLRSTMFIQFLAQQTRGDVAAWDFVQSNTWQDHDTVNDLANWVADTAQSAVSVAGSGFNFSLLAHLVARTT